MRIFAKLLAVVLLSVSQAFSQYTDLPIDSIEYSYTAPPDGYFTVYFKTVLPHSMATTIPGSGTIVLNRTARVVLVDGSGKERELANGVSLSTDFVLATITIAPTAIISPVPSGEQAVRVYFTLQDGNTTHVQKVDGIVIVATNASATFQTSIDAYNKAHALNASKSDNQRNIFAAMSISVPSGISDTQGNADLSFNHAWQDYQLASGALFDQFVVGATLKKSSSTGADSRHFDTGFSFRKDLLIGNAAWRKVISDAKKTALDPATRMADIKSAQDSFVFFAAALFDAGLQMEGDVKGLSIGNVSNLMANPTVRFMSPVWHSRSGVNAHLEIPTGVELGYNLTNNDLPSGTHYGLARYMAGESFTLFYDTNSDTIPINRVELSTQSSYRQLFEDEITVDPTSKVVLPKMKGPTYYTEGSFKILFASLGKGRPGFKISFKRGSLPPVYTFTKAFEFGLLFETSDDTQKK